MNSKDKIQHLLISHLLREGEIDLTLPDGIRLRVGLTKEGRNGFLEIDPDYCWVATSKENQIIHFDSYGLEVQYSDGQFVAYDDLFTEEGRHVNFVDIA